MTSFGSGLYRRSSDIIDIFGAMDDYRQFDDWYRLRQPGLPTAAQLRIGLTWHHEHMHRIDIMTTAFGLLLWRIDVSITIDARFLTEEFGRPPTGVPLKRWADISPLGIPVGLEEIKRHNRINEIVRELDALLQFREHLLGPTDGLSRAALAEEANSVLAILRHRFNLSTQWRFTALEPDSSASVTVPGRHSLWGVDVLERSATLWEAWVLRTGISSRWPEAYELWLDRRTVPNRFEDLGDLNDLTNIHTHRQLRISSLCGPCDPALDLGDDEIPIEAALPNMRWATTQPAAIHPEYRTEILPEPVAGVPTTVEVNQMLATATLNGEYGLFGNAKRAGLEALATDPTCSYLAFLLHRFQDEFWQRTRLDQNQASERELNVIYHLLTRFNDNCWVHPVEVRGLQIGPAQMGRLLDSWLY